MANNLTSQLDGLVIENSRTLGEADSIIKTSGRGILFVVDELNKICGVLTQGDLTRASSMHFGSGERVAKAMNRSFVAFREDTPAEEIRESNGWGYQYVPLINRNGEITSYVYFDDGTRIPIAKPDLSGNESKYVKECLHIGWISSQGKFVEKFEEIFAKYIGSRYAVSTSSGTTALHLALEALGIKQGDEVIVPTLTFIATANAVAYTGATPVFADSERDTWNIDPAEIEQKITGRTKAIIPVHLYGYPAKMDEIRKLAFKHNLHIVEDAAEAHGGEYKGKKVGGIGDIGVFSFFGNKIITTGEGGMLLTNDRNVYEKARILRDHGMSRKVKYWHEHVGYNYRITNLQAAIGCAQMERIDSILKEKEAIKSAYISNLQECALFEFPETEAGVKSVNWLFSVTLKDGAGREKRDLLLNFLAEKKIEARPFFFPVHTMPPYKRKERFTNAEYLAGNGLSLPSFVGLKERDIVKICNLIKGELR